MGYGFIYYILNFFIVEEIFKMLNMFVKYHSEIYIDLIRNYI